MTYNKIIEELIAENEKLQSNMNLHFAEIIQLQDENKKLKKELKETREFFVDKFRENKQLKERISKLLDENVKLQNDLFTQELNEDETEDYINQLKQELFNLYLKHYN